MNKKLLKIGLVLGTLCLTACENNVSSIISQLSSDNPSSEEVSSSVVPIEVNSLKTALLAINNTKNYTANVSYNGKYYYTIYVNENYVGTDSSDYDTMLDIYYNDGTGIYSINKSNGSFISSEYYLDSKGKNLTNLFDNSVVNTMYGIGTDYVSSIQDDVNDLVISNKVYKLALFDFIGLERSFYADLEEITVSYRNAIKFHFNFGEVSYDVSFSEFGETKSSAVELYLRNGGRVYKADENLKAMSNLVRSNNFVRNIYDINKEEDNGLYEVFNPNYFYTTGQPLGEKNATKAGYVSFRREKPIENTDSPYYIPDLPVAYGIYYFSAQGSRYGFMPNICSDNPDMEKFMHYPSQLEIVNKTQYFDEGQIKGLESYYATNKACYVCNELSLVKDFATNMSLTGSYPFDTCKPVALGVEILLSNLAKNTAIIFHYAFRYEGVLLDYKITLTQFGETNDDILEGFVSFYQD